MRWLLCALVGLMGLMAGVPAHAQLNARSHNIYPEQQIPVRFPHQRHLENGLVCEVCHSMVLGSTQAWDRHLPGHQLGGAWHGAEQPEAEMMFPKSGCQDCHPGWTEGSHTQIGPDLLPLPDGPKPPALVMPPARLTFSHKLHLDQGAVCLDCHPGIPRPRRERSSTSPRCTTAWPASTGAGRPTSARRATCRTWVRAAC